MGPCSERVAKATLAMPPNEECPNCHQKVEDWHVEWYMTEGPALYQGLAAMDCPLCGQPVGFQQANEECPNCHRKVEDWHANEQAKKRGP